MKKLIAIVAGEPNSINSEIIAKSWKVNKKNKNLFVIGNYYLFKKQINDIGINIPVTSIDKIQDIKKNMGLCVLNVPLNFKSVYDSNIVDTKKYVIKCLDIAHYLANTKKIIGFVNAPVDKKIFNKKYLGVTEYLAHKNNVKNK